MNIIFVNRFYHPETPATGQLLADLAEGLAARGHAVTVITARHRDSAVQEEILAGVRILRVSRTCAGGPPAKAVSFLRFHLAAFSAVRRVARAGSMLVVMTDPPLLGISAGLAAASRGACCIHWVQDVYPEIVTRLTRHRWAGLLQPLRNTAWRRAGCCVTLGEDMAALLLRNGVDRRRVVIQPNWAPAGLEPLPRDTDSPLRREWGLAGRFVVAYSGNLGRVHDLDPLLDLATLLRDAPEISFLFVGSGAGERGMRADATSRGLRNVSFLPPQPRERLAASLAVADLHAVTLRPGCEDLVFPSKLYGATAAGRPVLFIGPAGCEVARTVADGDLGLTATRTTLAEAARGIRQLAADPGRWRRHAEAARDFSRRHSAMRATETWDRLLSAIESGGPSREQALPGALARESFP
jgi:colanic acid biosynthesis glycosyl transferase WcaI